MKSFVLLITLLFSALLSKGQEPFEERYKDCENKIPCLDCGDPVLKQGDLSKYFQSKLKQANRSYPKQAGKIIYWVYVDSIGRPCVLKVKDGTLDEQLRNDIHRWINNAAWTAPVISGKPKSTATFLRFSFSPVELHVDQILFNHPDAVFHTRDIPDSAGQAAIRDKLKFTYIENIPRPGFDIQQYLVETMHYPDSARLAGVEGRVVVKFIVNEDGHVSNAEILHGIDHRCDEEAIRVVNAMPTWTPGTNQGKPVKVYFTLPITFKLEEKGHQSQQH